MQYTLAGIRRRVLIDKLDDDSFDTEVIDNFINDVQRDIFTKYKLTFMEKIFSGKIPAGVTMFKMPDDVRINGIQSQIIAATDIQPRSIKERYIEFRDFNRMYPAPIANQPGPIFRWSMYGDSMLTAQPTDREYTMTMFYNKKPKVLVEDADVPEIPEEFGELLVVGAYIKVLRRNEDNDIADNIEAREYAPKLLDLVTEYSSHKEGTTVMPNGYNRPGAAFNTTRNGLVQKSY
jgi:hypothetical protein